MPEAAGRICRSNKNLKPLCKHYVCWLTLLSLPLYWYFVGWISNLRSTVTEHNEQKRSIAATGPRCCIHSVSGSGRAVDLCRKKNYSSHHGLQGLVMRRLGVPITVNGLVRASSGPLRFHGAHTLPVSGTAEALCHGNTGARMLLLRARYLNAQRSWHGLLRHWQRSGPPRHFSTLRSLREAQKLNSSRDNAAPSREEKKDNGVDDDDGGESAFARSEKAAQAAKVNLSARLSKEGATANTTAGLGEVWRLIKIARPEAKWLGCMIFVPSQLHLCARDLMC